MGRRVNSFRTNKRAEVRQVTRPVVTVLAEADDCLLLVQLARGPFAGFWLLPSATVERGTIAECLRELVPARTGYAVAAARLCSVVEEPRADVLLVRFVFSVQVGAREAATDQEMAQARWFSRAAAREVLEERDVVPTLGVMALIRGWSERTPLRELELVVDDALCPCGSGDRFRACCGWDAVL